MATAAASTERSVRPVLLLTAGRIAAFAVTFATPLVLVRVFDQAGYGTYKQLILVYLTIATMAQLGMAESVLYFLPSAGPQRAGRYVFNSLCVLAASGLACLGLAILGGPYLARWLHNVRLEPLSPLLGVYVLLTLPATALELVMTARKRYGSAGAAYGLSDVLRAIAMVAPAVITGRLEWLLAGAVAFAAVRLAVTLVYVRWEFGARLRLDSASLREQLAYALPLQLGAALWVMVLNLHYYLVAAFVSTAAFAIYAVACTQLPLIDLVFTPAKNVMMVRIREAIAAGRTDAVVAAWHDTVRRLALLFFPIFGLLEVTARPLIPFLYTERYAASVPLFMLWVGTILIVPVQAFGVLGSYADTRTIAVLYGFELVLMGGLVPPLLRAFGLVGAVVAVILALSVGQSLFLLRAKRLMGVTLTALLPWRSLGAVLGAAAVAALAALAVKIHLPAPPLVLLIAISGVYAVTYAGMLTAFGFLAAESGQSPAERIRRLLGWPAKNRWRTPSIRILREVAYSFFALSGLTWIAARLNRRKILVLLYHGVDDGAMGPLLNFDGLHVRAERFDRQMRYVAAHYHVVPLDALLNGAAGKPAGKPLAAITFDDGYQNLYRHAYPVLKRLGLPATVFPITDYLERGRPRWWDRLRAMVAATRCPGVRTQVQGAARWFSLATVAAKQAALRALARELQACPPERRETALENLAADLGVNERELTTPRPLSASELRDMLADGISVGGHGSTHDSFLHLSRERLAVELAESKRALESLTGRSVHWLAYPYGDFSRETADAAFEAGYRGGLTTIEELNDGITDRLAIRRIGVDDNTSFARFLVATSGLKEWLKAVLKACGSGRFSFASSASAGSERRHPGYVRHRGEV